MGKLVLFLKDASPVEIPLAKERVMIGRRPDNDVCLPHPAVSGEHAAVVTILEDSFLEDLGSTNGTLVNGKPIAKHFLRDRDQIDIGRQLLVYLADEDAKAEPPAALSLREDRRDLVQRVEAARPNRPPEPAIRVSAVDADLGAALRVSSSEPRRAMPPAERAVAGRDLPRPGRIEAHPPVLPAADFEEPSREAFFDSDLVAIRQLRVDAALALLAETPEPDEPDEPAAPSVLARLRVLTGHAAGQIVPITHDGFLLGRVGVQVAAIVSRDGALWLVPREGVACPAVNGEPVPAEGREIAFGDGLEVAETRLELLAPV